MPTLSVGFASVFGIRTKTTTSGGGGGEITLSIRLPLASRPRGQAIHSPAAGFIARRAARRDEVP